MCLVVFLVPTASSIIVSLLIGIVGTLFHVPSLFAGKLVDNTDSGKRVG